MSIITLAYGDVGALLLDGYMSLKVEDYDDTDPVLLDTHGSVPQRAMNAAYKRNCLFLLRNPQIPERVVRANLPLGLMRQYHRNAAHDGVLDEGHGAEGFCKAWAFLADNDHPLPVDFGLKHEVPMGTQRVTVVRVTKGCGVTEDCLATMMDNAKINVLKIDWYRDYRAFEAKAKELIDIATEPFTQDLEEEDPFDLANRDIEEEGYEPVRGVQIRTPGHGSMPVSEILQDPDLMQRLFVAYEIADIEGGLAELSMDAV